MKLRWAFLLSFPICGFFAADARAATVAVMPVQGVNLSEGQCEAIGLFFGNAFARDAHVAVSSPAETKPVQARLRTSVATAQSLGASQYIELTAIRLGSKVTLAGILYASDGREIFRAETAASSLDEMDAASARLARALIWRQPVPPVLYAPPPPLPPAGTVPEPPAEPEAPPDPSASHNAYGPKGGLVFPVASGRSFSPQISLQFDARIGPRGHFFEIGAGFAAPAEDQYGSTDLRVTSLFAELGASAFLTDGSVGIYLGGGVVPGLWQSRYSSYDSYSTNSGSGAMCAIYGQLGVNFTRDIRTRIYTELRISQHLLGVNDASNGDTFHPTMLAMQMGLGW
jgi:hypothetical protein